MTAPMQAQSKEGAVKLDKNTMQVANLVVVDGDTIPTFLLHEVPVTSNRISSKADQRAYRKLKRNLIKVYPYAQRAIDLMRDIELTTAKMDKKRKKKKYIKAKEKELKDQFKKELKKLTVSQGKVLIKLIERDTKEPFYRTLKDMKNPVSAFFWQTISKRFGYNLKEGYDVEKQADLEELVVYLEEHGLMALARSSYSYRYKHRLRTESKLATQKTKSRSKKKQIEKNN